MRNLISLVLLSAGFLPAHAEPAKPLVVYSTYLGGDRDDYATAVAVDGDGSAYVAGETLSRNLPAKPVSGTAPAANNNGFVARISPEGDKIIWCVTLGGDSATRPNAIAIDPAGNIWVTGRTGARNFPLVNPVQDRMTGLNIVFLVKLSPEGKLLFSTLFGGERNDEANAIAIDSAGAVYIAGRTNSSTFPEKQPVAGKRGGGDAFLARFSNDGKLEWSTLLGGTGADEIFALAVGPDGDVYAAGDTSSTDAATDGSWQPKYLGLAGFAARVAADGSALRWMTYVGARPGYTSALGIAADEMGAAYVVRHTSSKELPVTANALQPKFAGGLRDAYLLKLSADGSAAEYLTYIGGAFTGSHDPDEMASAVRVDSHGLVYVAGTTASSDFRTARAVQNSIGGSDDAWVARLDLAGGRVVSSSFWGGGKGDELHAFALGPGENVTIVGQSLSLDYPTTAAFQTKAAGNNEAVVSRICDPWLSASAGSVEFVWTAGAPPAEAQQLEVRDGCTVRHEMTEAVAGAAWLSATPDRMAMPGKLTLGVRTEGLEPGEYETSITVTVPEAANGPLIVPVKLRVLPPAE